MTARRGALRSDDVKIRVFVYGTLLAGEPNHAVLGGARLLQSAKTAPRFRLLDLGPYPALLEGGQTAVHGEVYEVDRVTLNEIDEFEGHPDLFRRTLIELDDGTRAHAYLLSRTPEAGCTTIDSGDF